jgi:hypothetical protein
MTAAYRIRVLGPVGGESTTPEKRRLSPASKQLLAFLVAVGPRGISPAEIARERGHTQPPAEQAVRMAMVRLRRQLGDDVFPRADDGVYRLALPPEEVDVWHLQHLVSSPIQDVSADQIRHLLRPAIPYEDVSSSTLLEDSELIVRQRQIDLLIKVAQADSGMISGEILDGLILHVQNDPLNEALIAATVSVFANAGRRVDALRLLRTGRRAFMEVGLELDPDLIAFERRLLADSTVHSDSEAGTKPAAATLPAQLQARLDGPYVGDGHALSSVLATLEASPPGVITIFLRGLAGSGKTRLSAEVAGHANGLGWSVVFLAPSMRETRTPFGPLIAAMPHLGVLLTRAQEAGLDADSTRVSMWTAARSGFDEIGQSRPLLLVVDDGQWLDDSTLKFLSHLLTGRSAGPFVVLVNGRDDVNESGLWQSFSQQLAALSARTIELGPLDASGIRSLVNLLRPNMNGALLSAAASEIFERSAGLPGVAIPLLAALPPNSAVLPPSRDLSGGLPLAAAIETLTPIARQVGIAAAVVGPAFRFDDIRQMLPLTDNELLAALDELIERQLIDDVSIVEFEVVHAVVKAALLEIVPRQELAELHCRAAELPNVDVHRRADHLAAALPMIPVAEAVESLLASARQRLHDGASRESIRRFSTAAQLTQTPLSPTDLGGWARALDLCGMHDDARLRRQQGFDFAASDDHWADAFSIAVSGLPEAEQLDGDQALTDNLLRIDIARLDPTEAARHATIAARQLSIVGDDERARFFAKRAVDLASTPAEIADAHLSMRLSMSGVATAQDCLAVSQTAAHHVDSVSAVMAGDCLLNLCLDEYGVGDVTASLATLQRLKRINELSAVRVWHSTLMEAMLHTDAGRAQDAQTVRTRAHRFASDAGMGEADNALLAATFVDLWLSGSSAALAGEVDGGVLDPSHRGITMAGAAAALWDAGERERAAELARSAATFAFAGARPQRLCMLAVICQPLIHANDRTTLAAADSAFEAAGESMLVLGAGAASFGPAARYRAQLAQDPMEREKFLHASLSLAERSGALLWRAIARRDLVGAGHTEFGDELTALVAGSELMHLDQRSA